MEWGEEGQWTRYRLHQLYNRAPKLTQLWIHPMGKKKKKKKRKKRRKGRKGHNRRRESSNGDGVESRRSGQGGEAVGKHG